MKFIKKILFLEEHLTLYIKTIDGLSQLWRHTSYNNYSRWIAVTVDIPQTNVSSFSLVFFTEFMKDCPNSVGIDDIMFHRCPKGKKISHFHCDQRLEIMLELRC